MKTLWTGNTLSLVKTDPTLDLVSRIYVPSMVLLSPRGQPGTGEAIHHCIVKISKDQTAELAARGITYGKLNNGVTERLIARAMKSDGPQPTNGQPVNGNGHGNGHHAPVFGGGASTAVAPAMVAAELRDKAHTELLDNVIAAGDLYREQIEILRQVIAASLLPV